MEIYFILVEPAVPENVGAAARAIKTMSFNKLRLVTPCDYLSTESRKLAHGAGDILTSATVFSSLGEAVEDLDFVIGTSAKARRVRHDYYRVDRLPKLIAGKGNLVKKAGVVFGREESGLTNDEIRLCDIIGTIPMAGSYPSLNLAQAVMVVAYELSSLVIGRQKKPGGSPGHLTLKATRARVSEILHAAGVDNNKTLYNRIMERINVAGEDDLHLLCSVCKYFGRSKI